MCQFFSGIITEKKILYDLDYDSHEKLIKKNGLDDTTMKPKFIRVELLPPNGNIFDQNLSKWDLRVDQDIIPKWFNEKQAEKEMRKALQSLMDERFVINDKSWKKLGKGRFFIKNSSVVAWENSSVKARGNSSVVAWENSSVVAWENSSVVARENSSVVAWENSSVVAWENSSVVAWENSSVVARGNSSVVAWGNSSVVAWGNSSVVARGNSSVVAWGNSSVVAWGNSSVVARENSSVVIPYSEQVIIKKIEDNGSVKDLSGNIPKIIIANPEMKLEIFEDKHPKK